MNEGESNREESIRDETAARADGKRIYVCDRCGAEMREKSCKVTCPNCGNRFDCSDLNIYFD